MLEKTQSAPERAEVTLRWREDRGYLNANLADVTEDTPLTEQTFNASAPHAARVIELPFAYTKSVEPSVPFLVSRGDRVSNGFNGYVETSADSYDQVGSSGVFALHGTLQAGFPASVLREDDTAELDVSFDSPDRTLESVAYDSALRAGPMRLFIGDEIMLGYTATLVSSGRYRIKALRARFGTHRRSHLIGTEVFALIIGLNLPLTHALAWNPSLATARFKCQPFLLQAELDLALTEVASVTVQRRAYCPPPPSNLRVFDDGHCPTYATGQNLTVQWDTTSERRCVSLPGEALTPSAEQTVLVITTTGGIEMAEIAVASATGPATITNAALVAALGSETDFVLRAYAERAGFRSLTFDAITVRKV